MKLRRRPDPGLPTIHVSKPPWYRRAGRRISRAGGVVVEFVVDLIDVW